MATYQFVWSQSSHEECGPSVGRLTPRPPDPSATLRDSELAGAQCVSHDTESQDKALWHSEPKSRLGLMRIESLSPSEGLIATLQLEPEASRLHTSLT